MNHIYVIHPCIHESCVMVPFVMQDTHDDGGDAGQHDKAPAKMYVYV